MQVGWIQAPDALSSEKAGGSAARQPYRKEEPRSSFYCPHLPSGVSPGPSPPPYGPQSAEADPLPSATYPSYSRSHMVTAPSCAALRVYIYWVASK